MYSWEPASADESSLVDPVREHGVARLLVGRMLGHDLVERGLRVEHHRPQLALARVDARLREQRGVDLALDVSQLGEAERVGQPLRRVDREHGDLEAAGRHSGGDRG